MSHADATPRILITRLSAVGDCILTLPLACALRRHFPQAELMWAVEPLAATLLSRHPAIDRLIVVPKGWLKSPRLIRTLRRRLMSLHCDCVLDPQSLTKSSLLGWFSGARRRIGFARPQGREVAPWVNTECIERGDSTHIVDASLRLLTALGITAPDVQFNLPALPQADAYVDAFVRSACLAGGYAVINGAASWRSKQWPADRLGRVARHLGERYELPTVVAWAGRREATLAQHIISKSGGHALQAPATSLPQLATLMRRARLVVSADTGPLHLAAAVGTPCIGLYGPTRVELSGPYGPQHITIQADCPPAASRHQRRTDESAMRSITTEQVCEACDMLLGRLPAATAPQTHAA
ncbi:MAG: glycosyltransferase family 9 protein [Planctomycetaceae bacterium]|nr:glycosyltransferase family 9 protein [Planctomycetaceae bacterium]